MEVEDENKKKVTVPNPAYTAWVAKDQTVLSFLVNSLSPEIMAHVLDLQTTAEVWSVITNMFSTTSRTRINHLPGALNNTKKGDLTAAAFFAPSMRLGLSTHASIAWPQNTYSGK